MINDSDDDPQKKHNLDMKRVKEKDQLVWTFTRAAFKEHSKLEQGERLATSKALMRLRLASQNGKDSASQNGKKLVTLLLNHQVRKSGGLGYRYAADAERPFETLPLGDIYCSQGTTRDRFAEGCLSQT